MNWYVKKAMQDPAAHIDDTPPTDAPLPHEIPSTTPDSLPPRGLKLRPGRKKGKGLNLWRKNRE